MAGQNFIDKALSLLGDPDDLEEGDQQNPPPSGADILAMAASPMAPPTGAEILDVTGPPTGGPVMDWVIGANDAIAGLLDAPGAIPDAVTGLPVTPGNFRNLFVDLGFSSTPGQEPNTAAYSGGHLFGNSLPLYLAGPLGAGMARAAPGLTAFQTGGREVAKRVGETIVKSPVTSTALEITSATAAGIGGHTAHKAFPDSPAAESIGYILGGLAPVAAVKSVELAAKGALGFAKLMPLTGPIVSKAQELTVNGIRRVRETITVRGGTRRAIRRIEHALPVDLKGKPDPTGALKNLEEPGVLPDARLTPAQKTGEPLLLALERSIIESSDTLQLDSDKQIAELNALIYRSMQDLGGDPEAARVTFETAQKYLLSLLDGRLRVAAVRADKRVAALKEGASPEEANLIAREEILGAHTAGRDQESELWNLVSDKITASFQTSRGVLKKELKTRGRTADPADIPDYVHKFLGRLNNKGQMTPGMKGVPTIKEVRTLRSRILADLRGEKGVKLSQNSRRIMRNLEEALLSDMGAERDNVQGEVGQALRQAFDYSNLFNERFTRGPVGKLLRTAKGGGEQVPPELTLETTLGLRGPRAAVNAKALIASVKDVDDEVMQGALEDFVKSRFNGFAIRGGVINETKAEDFLRQNKALLDQFPAIRNDIEKAIVAGDARLLADRRLRTVGSRMADPRISKATMFIQRDPVKAFQAIAESRNVKTEVQNIINMTNRDFTGEATDGLRGAFSQWILQRSTVAAHDFAHEAFVSGNKMRHVLADPNTNLMARKILGPEKFERLELIVKTAERLDNILAAAPAKEGIIADVPNALISILGRVSGAQIARKFAAKFGGGTVQTPGIAASAMNKLLISGVKDPAQKLIIAAVTSEDDELMQALLRGTESVEDVKFVSQRINAWLAAVLFDIGGDITQQEEQPLGP